MNTQVAKIDTFRAEVLPPEKATELYAALPSHVRPEVFERNLMNALMANPDLMTFDPRLVYREVAKAAGLGLLLDPILGEAYIVTAYNYKTKRTEPQLRVGYKGTCKLARQSGIVSNIYAHEVHEKDHVEADLGFPKVFHHRPKLFGDRGPVIGYVAVITFKDGSFDFEPMSVEQVHEIRDRSDAWKAYKDGKIKTTPWSTDDGEMSKKTVLRRLLKRQSQSPEMVAAQRIEDEAEFPHMLSGPSAAVPRDAGPPSARAIRAPAEPQDEPAAGTDDLPPEAEKPSQEPSGAAGGDDFNTPAPADHPQPEEPYTLPTERQTFESLTEQYIVKLSLTTAPGQVFGWADKNYAALDKIKEQRPALWAKIKKVAEDQLVKLRVPTTETKDTAKPKAKPKGKGTKAAPDPGQMPDPAGDPEAVRAWIDARLSRVESADELEPVWNAEIAPGIEKMMPPDQDDMMAVYQHHERRLGGD